MAAFVGIRSLIASELLTNALRHAFPPGTSGEVTLKAVSGGGKLEMTVADGGAGLPATPLRHGLGTTVMTALARQIGATLTSQSKPGAGTTVALHLALPAVSEVAAGAAMQRGLYQSSEVLTRRGIPETAGI